MLSRCRFHHLVENSVGGKPNGKKTLYQKSDNGKKIWCRVRKCTKKLFVAEGMIQKKYYGSQRVKAVVKLS